MRAIRLHGVGDLRLETIAEPEITALEEVKVRVACAGICGSDLHNFATGMWLSRTPSTPGHEFAGEVIAVGSPDLEFKPGDRVVADSRVPCGSCETCASGHGYLCAGMGFVGEVNDGGFAEMTVQPARLLRRLPDPSVSYRVAAMAEPLAVALHAVNRLDAERTGTVLIAGAGPIGALCALVLNHRGQARVLIADRNEKRRSRVAEVCGAQAVDLAALPDAPDAAIDATGAPAATDAVVKALRRGGRLAIVGLYHGIPQIDLNAIVEGGLSVSGCAAFDTELDDAIALLAPLAAALESLSEPPAPIDRTISLYRELTAPETGKIKALIAP